MDVKTSTWSSERCSFASHHLLLRAEEHEGMCVPDPQVPEKGKDSRHFMDTANPRVFTMRAAWSMPT